MLNLCLFYLLLLRNEDIRHGNGLFLEITELILKALQLFEHICVFFLLCFHHRLYVNLNMLYLFLVYLQSLPEPVYVRELITRLEHSRLQLCNLFYHGCGVVEVESDLGHHRDGARALRNERVHVALEHRG
jgi:hypothetical protein